MISLGEVGSAVIEALETDAGLSVDEGGTGVWAAPDGANRFTPVERAHNPSEGSQWYELRASDGSAWRITVEQVTS